MIRNATNTWMKLIFMKFHDRTRFVKSRSISAISPVCVRGGNTRITITGIILINNSG